MDDATLIPFMRAVRIRLAEFGVEVAFEMVEGGVMVFAGLKKDGGIQQARRQATVEFLRSHPWPVMTVAHELWMELVTETDADSPIIVEG